MAENTNVLEEISKTIDAKFRKTLDAYGYITHAEALSVVHEVLNEALGLKYVADEQCFPPIYHEYGYTSLPTT